MFYQAQVLSTQLFCYTFGLQKQAFYYLLKGGHEMDVKKENIIEENLDEVDYEILELSNTERC